MVEFRNILKLILILVFFPNLCTGQIVLQPPDGFVTGDLVTDGLIMSMDQNTGKWGFMNKQGTMIIPARFDRVLPFKNGIAPAMTDGK